MAADLFHPPGSAMILPEEVLLSIFQHLSPSDLCRASRTCEQWRRLANDRCLWRTIDFRREELKPAEMWSIASSHLSDDVRALHFKARLSRGNLTLANPKMELLESICRECPNLEELSFIQVRMKYVDIDSFPRNLRKLSLVNTSIGSVWLVPPWYTSEDIMFDKLTHLDLSGSIHICDDDFTTIVASEPPLEYLNANCLPEIGQYEIEAVSDHLGELKHLEISRIDVVSNWRHHVFNKLKKLVYLDVSYSARIDDPDLEIAATNLTKLRTLNVSDCVFQGNNPAQLITRLKSLSYVDVTRTVLAAQDNLDLLHRSLPNCTIITESPVLPKLPWKNATN